MRNVAASTEAGRTATADLHQGENRSEQRPGPGALDLQGLDEVELVGRARLGARFRARQQVTGRPVEVLVLDDDDPDAIDGFVRDGTIGAKLSGQSGVVPVFEAGTTPSGHHYLVRPYYSRGSLGRLLADHGPLSWREATHLAEQIGVTVAEIHGWGIVHQGLEPGNIMLTEFLLPRVGEFGASTPVGADLVVGANPAPLGPFAAPESSRNGEARTSSDVYSLGAILWSLLAGRDPAPADSQPVPAPALETPGPLVDLLRRSMSRRVHERPANGAAFVTELRRAVNAIEADGDLTSNGRNEASPSRAGRPSDGADAVGLDDSSVDRAAVPQATHRLLDSSSPPETRYILVLVGMIALAVLVMVAAAVLTTAG